MGFNYQKDFAETANGSSKAVAKDEFYDEAIGAVGEAEADAEVEFPFGREIQVERGKDLLLLFAPGIEMRDWPE